MNMIALRRNMGYVIRQTGLFSHMTVRENIEILPRLEHRDAKSIADRTQELMKMVGRKRISIPRSSPVASFSVSALPALLHAGDGE